MTLLKKYVAKDRESNKKGRRMISLVAGLFICDAAALQIEVRSSYAGGLCTCYENMRGYKMGLYCGWRTNPQADGSGDAKIFGGCC